MCSLYNSVVHVNNLFIIYYQDQTSQHVSLYNSVVIIIKAFNSPDFIQQYF